MDARGPASAGRKFERELCTSIDARLGLLIVACHPVGIEAVFVARHRELPRREEGQVDSDIAGSPVGHGADVPVVATTASDDNVLGDLAGEHAGVVPNRGYGGEELHRAGLTEIVRGTVGQL